MPRLTKCLEDHHKHCDDAFAEAEAAVMDGRWDEAARRQGAFRADMDAHFHAEETVLFPAFESASGSTGGPTEVMRTEHGQIRDVLDAMAEAIRQKNADEFSGHAETLVILMQQHNLKEENILYPMCDSTLGGRAGELAEQLMDEICSA